MLKFLWQIKPQVWRPSLWLDQSDLSWVCTHLSLGGVLKTSGPADFKSVPGFENWPRFEGVIGQNKIQQTYDHDCISIRSFRFDFCLTFWINKVMSNHCHLISIASIDVRSCCMYYYWRCSLSLKLLVIL